MEEKQGEIQEKGNEIWVEHLECAEMGDREVLESEISTGTQTS